MVYFKGRRKTKNGSKKKVNNTQENNIDIKPTQQTSNNALEKALEIIKRWEGLKLTSYLCPAGVWTIGYGTTKINGVAVKQGMQITLEQAEEYLAQDCQVFYNAVCNEVGNICNDNQIASLTSFTYNVGVGAFRKSTLLKVIKKADIEFLEEFKKQNSNIREEEMPTAKELKTRAITKQFMSWVFAGKKRVQGLENRRKAEIELYFS